MRGKSIYDTRSADTSLIPGYVDQSENASCEGIPRCLRRPYLHGIRARKCGGSEQVRRPILSVVSRWFDRTNAVYCSWHVSNSPLLLKCEPFANIKQEASMPSRFTET
jgi:hypothetical protein